MGLALQMHVPVPVLIIIMIIYKVASIVCELVSIASTYVHSGHMHALVLVCQAKASVIMERSIQELGTDASSSLVVLYIL